VKIGVKKETNHSLLFKIFSTVLIVQVIVIIASASTRLSLYEEAYGFTTLRLYSHAFIIVLAVIFCLLLYKIHINSRENVFISGIFISTVLFLVVKNFLNPDAFIARRNIERFTASGKLDIDYLSNLSDDAAPEMIKVLNLPDEDLRNSFARKLYWHTQNSHSPYRFGWQSLNISLMRAYKILSSRIHDLEPYKDYQQQDFDSKERHR